MSNKKNAVIVIILSIVFLVLGVVSLALFLHVPVLDLITPAGWERRANGTVGVGDGTPAAAPAVVPDWEAQPVERDPSLRLEKRGGELTEEEVIAYISALIPEEYRDERMKFGGFRQYDAVRLEPKPGLEDTASFDPPYDDLMAVEECTAVDIALVYDFADAYYGPDTMKKVMELSDGFLMGITEAAASGSDYPFGSFPVDVYWGGTHVVNYGMERNLRVVDREEYAQYHPDYRNTMVMYLTGKYNADMEASEDKTVLAEYKGRAVTVPMAERAENVQKLSEGDGHIVQRSRDEIVEDMLIEFMLDDEAAAQGITASQEELDEYMGSLKGNYDEYEVTREAVDAFCKGAGITVDEYWAQAEESVPAAIARRRLESRFWEAYCAETGTSPEATATLSEAYDAYCAELFEAHRGDVIYH